MNKQFKTLLAVVFLFGMALMLPGVKALEATPSVAISDVTITHTSIGISISGALDFSNADVAALNVKMFCDGVEKANVLSGLDGKFKVTSNDCRPKQDAFVQVEFNGQVVESTHLVVPRQHSRGIDTNGITTNGISANSISTNASPVGVPEFSLLTLGTAVVVVTLGLVFLRKN